MNTQTNMAALAATLGRAFIVNGPMPQDIEELRETIEALSLQMRNNANQQRSITGRADAQKRDITAAEAEKLDGLSARFDAMEAELKIAKAELEEAEQDAHGRTPQARMTAPNAIGGSETGARRTRAPNFTQPARTYSAMFGNVQDPLAGRFESFGEFALAVAAGGNDQRLIRNAGMVSTTGTDGGFAVPLQFLGPVLDAALAMEVVRPRANVIPMASKTATAGVFDYLDGTSGKRAGLQLLWGSEAAPLTEQKGKVREMTLDAKKGSILVRVSNELAADAPAFDRQLGQAMVAAVAIGLDMAFLAGNGAGQPLGILNAPVTITVAKESGQAANTLFLQNLANMVGKLHPASFARSVWLVHPTAVPSLYLMSYTVKNVAGTENVGGTAAQAITQDADGTLRIFGRPVAVTEACSAFSAAGDIMLCDFSRYAVGLRADASIKRDESVYFASDELAFRLTLRVDGQPQDGATTKLKDGSNTVSPFVVLGAR